MPNSNTSLVCARFDTWRFGVTIHRACGYNGRRSKDNACCFQLHHIMWIQKFSRGLYFREPSSHMRNFVKIKLSRNGKITLWFIDIGKSCLSHEFFKSLICLLMLFAKISESTLHIKLRLYRFWLNELHYVRKHVCKTWFNMLPRIKWAVTWDFQQYGMCYQQSLRSAYAYAQSDQNLC